MVADGGPALQQHCMSSTLARHNTNAKRVRDMIIVLGLALLYCGPPSTTYHQHWLGVSCSLSLHLVAVVLCLC